MADKLRGSPEGLTTKVPKRLPKYGNRVDGTPKGIGYFGEITRSDDPEAFSTELSMTFGDLLAPLIVPTLTAEEIAHLVDGGQPTKSIVRKAIDHAEARIKAGKSPYAEEGEIFPLPQTPNQQFEKGFT